MEYVAQRFGTWEVLDRNLPVTVTDGPEWGLNLYGVLEGTIAPDIGNATAPDGHPVVAEWGTVISCETGTGPSRRRWQGLVDKVEPDGAVLKIRARELHGYPDGLTYTGRVHGVQVDPAAVFADLYAEVQTGRNDLGVTVSGLTGLKVGTDSDLKADAAMVVRDAAKKDLEAAEKPRKAIEERMRKIRKNYAPSIEQWTENRDLWVKTAQLRADQGASQASIDEAKTNAAAARAELKIVQDARKVLLDPLDAQLKTAREAAAPLKVAYDKTVDAYNKARDKAREDGGGLKIEGADFPDLWKELRKLAAEHGFEFTSRVRWTDDTRPDFRVVISYPTTGRARPDLVFQQGVNIVSELKPRSLAYASEILGRGAGEGDEAVRASAARTDWRVKRNRVLARPDTKKAATLRAEVRQELGWSLGDFEIPSIEVIDHDLARFYSWACGDSILVQGEIPHVGPYSEWHRIMSWKLLRNGHAQLNLEKVVTT